MRVFRGFLRVYSYIFETILCAMGLGLAGFGLALRLPLHIGWLPWDPAHLVAWVLSLSVAGLLSVGLAISGKLRFLLVVFSGFVVYLLGTGLFLNSPYRFTGPSDAKNAFLLLAGAIVAFAGSWPVLGRRR